ncbi:MAG: hypothetical protein A2505_01860 [Deltaproteobacteria bacterium RIFOXYD12_FULL_55_16]|nr:MAG: hypothetical protein A2505_01860 [Deltaproteobacteria bacterium RIFOXYD12_FULL_55_16]
MSGLASASSPDSTMKPTLTITPALTRPRIPPIARSNQPSSERLMTFFSTKPRARTPKKTAPKSRA